MVETMTITHCCGHDKRHTIRGGDQARAAAADWLATTLCRECWLSPDVDRDAHPASFARTSPNG